MTDTPNPSDATTVKPSHGSRGRRIGPYRILQKVGEGGMGEVYEAEQERPVRRRVALKVIKAGMDSKQVVARFEAERQALAMMDHPAVAKVFDAGITPKGQPYFAMEFIQGTPITEYCDRQRLTTAERIRLFNQVCEGVQHAHQKAIIHRDLKPSNVLVATQDGKRLPKIIDFGVAKATTHKLTERTLFTELGVLIGTPEYMSPEQAEMTGENVDTRTDVYSLGVMLYELLVGALPFDSEELREAGFEGIRRKIREEEPSRPSTRLTTLGGKASEESAQLRRTSLLALKKQLQGDLDWITMKALEKDRTRRYGSPAELAADLERQLRHEPVEARPPSAVYRAQKFVRRNRVGVGVAVAGVVVLLAVAAAMVVQSGRTATERDRANREAELSKRALEFMTGLFEISDPSEARGNSITVREILDRGAAKIQRELKSQPLIQARLMDTMGRVYQSLGLMGQAGPLLEETLRIRQTWLVEDHPEVAESLSHLGWLRQFEGRFVEAEEHHRGALAIRAKILGESHVDTAWSLYHIALLHAMQGENREAKSYYERALPIFEEQAAPDHIGVAWCLNDLGALHNSAGDLDKAAAFLERALEIKERLFGPGHPDVARGIANLGEIQKLNRNYQPAMELFERALELRQKIYSSPHPELAINLGNLAVLRMLQGEVAQAESLHRRAVEMFEGAYGLDHPESLLYQASWFGARGERALALQHLRRALERGFSSNWSLHDPAFDSLRGDPEFEAIVASVEKVKLEASGN